MVSPLSPLSQMEVWYDIDDEDEDLTLEDFLDKKMGDWELSQVESVYSLACSCLHERKNRRPFIKQVQGGQTDVQFKLLCWHLHHFL